MELADYKQNINLPLACINLWMEVYCPVVSETIEELLDEAVTFQANTIMCKAQHFQWVIDLWWFKTFP